MHALFRHQTISISDIINTPFPKIKTNCHKSQNYPSITIFMNRVYVFRMEHFIYCYLHSFNILEYFKNIDIESIPRYKKISSN